jgi:hypothetical protein
MNVYQCDPIRDPRWAELVKGHDKASVFHSVEWLRVLQETYRYDPIVFTTCPATEVLRNGIVVCRINSWLTGRRLVSLPFSDYCEPLFDSDFEFTAVLDHLLAYLKEEGYQYLCIRPLSSLPAKIFETKSAGLTHEYFLHSINLEPALDVIYKGFDKDSIQRRIRRAERARLVERCGQSQELLREFYGLFLTTRRRQGVPPTPFVWFQNLARELGDSLEVRIAYKDKTPISAIISLQFREIGYYKYGCSDYHFNQFGATPWLFWRAISSAKSKGVLRFDLGRTDKGNAGLLVFKNHWDPNPKQLAYWQVPIASHKGFRRLGEGSITKTVFSLLPRGLQKSLGEFVYPHFG